MELNGYSINSFNLEQVDTHLLHGRDIDDRPVWITCRPLEYAWDYRHCVMQLDVSIDILEDADPRSENCGRYVEGVIIKCALLPANVPEGPVHSNETSDFELNGWMLKHLGPDMSKHVEIYKNAFDQIEGDICEIEVIQPRLLRLHYMRLHGLTDEHAVDVGECDYLQGYIRHGRIHLLRTPPTPDENFSAVDMEGAQYVAEMIRLRDRLGERWFDNRARLKAMYDYLASILRPLILVEDDEEEAAA